MKFSCEQSTLVKALNTVSKAVTSRTTIPILKGILLDINNEGILTMSASDLEIGIEKSFKVDNFEAGSTVVQSKLFGDIIRKLPSGIITIEENNNNVVIKCSNSEFNIIGSSKDEFPKIGNNEKAEKLVFDKEVFKEMILKTAFSASIDESRGIITGILIELKENELNMVSLDGFRMAVKREVMNNNLVKNIVIPAKTLVEVAKIISETEYDDSTIEMLITNNKATFIISDTKVELTLLNGDFVNYNNILPKESKIEVVVNKNDLLDSVERASLLAKVGKNNLIKLDIKGNNIEVTSKSEEGNVKENVLVTKTGDDLVIGFNSKYLIDALKIVDEDEIKLLFNTSISPLLINPIQGKNYEYLVLPVRITN